eukprot:1108191-Heterocapsa_arctica.AAC.1
MACDLLGSQSLCFDSGPESERNWPEHRKRQTTNFSSGVALGSPATERPGHTTCWLAMGSMRTWKWPPFLPTSRSSTTMFRIKFCKNK